jgi:hypothetical protein
MTHATGPAGVVGTEPSVEVRFTVDAGEPPLAYARGFDAVDVEVVGPAGWTMLTLPLAGAREWAGELYAAVSVVHREATGDPHALTDDELAALDEPKAYDAGPGVLVVGDGGDRASVRFHVVVDIAGDCLSTAHLREALVAQAVDGFNATRIAVSAGEVLAGRVWPPSGPK